MKKKYLFFLLCLISLSGCLSGSDHDKGAQSPCVPNVADNSWG